MTEPRGRSAGRTTRAAVLCAALVLCRIPAAAAGPFSERDGAVSVVTSRYEARIEAGALVFLRNLLTGETYTVADAELGKRIPHLLHGLATKATLPPDGGKELEEMHQWAGSYRYEANWASVHHPTRKSAFSFAVTGPSSAAAVWKGLEAFNPPRFFPEETYELSLRILPGSGDLEIVARAAGSDPGVYGVGFPMTGFSKRVSFVLPETNGYRMTPGPKPAASATHWPQPWHAALVIGEGARGSFGLWMADPAMKDRYLHKRNNPDCYDIAFESVNDAPFDALTAAVSRPMRINVYAGNWMEPARAFRDWWETAFAVRPIAERTPAWLRDVAFASQHYAPPPKEMIPRTLFWAPQHWKVGPAIGDGGLFPYDIEKGPELAALKNSLPVLAAADGNVMVYLNINHMNEGHPWAPRFWKHRLVRPFGKREIERDPKFEAPGSFLVNTAFRPWQDLIIWWAEESYKRFGIRGFYLDCAVGTPNSAFGTIDGKNDCLGEVELMKRMKERIPDCWLGVEYVTEVTATAADTGFVGYDSWWPGSLPEREKSVHPILGFLFNRYVHLWYCSGSDPVFDETIGRLPHTAVRDLTDAFIADYCVPEDFGAFFARLRWKTSMKPVYPDAWEPNVRAYYRGPDATEYRIVADTPRESRMVARDRKGRERLVYWRIKDRTEARIEPATGIPGWIAYRGETAIGLNPAADYLYTAEPRIRDWEVASLPEGAFVSVCRPYRDGLLALDMGTPDGKDREGTVELLSTVKIAAAVNRDGRAEIEQLGAAPDGRFRCRIRATVPGAVAFSTSPPAAPAESLDLAKAPFRSCLWELSGLRQPIEKRLAAQADAKGVVKIFPRWENSGCLDWMVRLPEVPLGKRLLMRPGTLITPHAGNNAIFVVSVNGRERLNKKITGTAGKEPTFHEIDLTPFAGKDALLSVQARNCYLFNWIFLHRLAVAAE